MRRLLGPLATALAVLAGLLAGPATAAGDQCSPYVPDCGGPPARVTVQLATRKIQAGHRPRARVVVRSRGAATARGTVRFTVTRLSTGRTWESVREYAGAPLAYRGPRLTKPGAYRLRARFTRVGQTVVVGRTAQRFTVARARHR